MAEKKKKILVGGQAVIEGIMMRAPGAYATSVRRADGTIETERHEFRSILEKHKSLNIPVLRGIIALFETLKIGIGTLQWSADKSMEDLEPDKTVSKPDTLAKTASLLFALLVGLGLFFVLPLTVTTKFFEIERDAVLFNLVSGAIRITLFLGYIGAISLMEDIKILFRYHGAEHKMIFAFEGGCELLPSEAKKFIRFHPRCGTSFLLIVMLVSILVFALIDSIIISYIGSISLGVRLLSHLPMIPFVAGLGYEAIKLSGRYGSTAIGRVLVAPGLWLQRLTTKEPDDAQLEVAAVALKSALGEDYDKFVGDKFEADTVQ
ncbi:DUF1385 domain-containing protein [Candidatus Marinimicrobia bacterium MT.SAG.4]|nr:DUF1385 domain-containing protein [Candidatus Marinimicrobia bacterium MT.SAG.4]TFB13754.1 DUF1385 domain-containing protein [Candidatus Marinimicrobia bacterium MT.SAG.4]